MNSQKPAFFSETPEALSALMAEWKELNFRSTQLKHWIFSERQPDPSLWTNLPKALVVKLRDHYDFSLPRVKQRLDSPDGASKLLLAGPHSEQVFEAVILRYENRTSLCVSSQVGCKLSCAFCQTGKLGFFRNLSAAEIVGQFLLANQIVSEEGRRITHVVFMGMGEPLDNFAAVNTAVALLHDAYGLSRRKITVSTSGLVPQIRKLAESVKSSLALSLHACRDELRTRLMPINKKYPLAELKQSLLDYQRMSGGEEILIEYILIRGENCSAREANELIRFLHGLKVKINLIPFNAHPGLQFSAPTEEEIRSFQERLSRSGFAAPVRYSKGLNVSAACGQLAAKSQDLLTQVPQRRNVIA